MKIFYNIFNKISSNKGGIISLGFFDSLHFGHKKIISELLKISHNKKLIHYVLTFKNHPLKGKNGKKILELEDRLDNMRKLGIKNIILCDFEKIYKLEPEKFISLLKNNFNINEYVVCSDFYFGFKKSGNISTLQKLNCKINIIDPIYLNDKKISTTLIRDLILKGNVDEAIKYLGKPFYIKGIVRKGKQKGRNLGYPTMNIKNDNLIYPSNGVYITKTFVKNKYYNSMTYVAFPNIETFLMNYNKFSYNHKIKVDFFKKIRDNLTFKNDDLLKLQLNKDLNIIKNFKKV